MSFFDTPDLRLNRSGVVVGARRVQRKGDDSVVKLRPVVPEELPAEFVFAELRGRGRRDAGRLRLFRFDEARARDDRRQGAVTGKRPLRKLFSKEQRALYTAHAPEGLELEDLSIRPDLRAQAEAPPEGYGRRLVAELWIYPDNSMLLELSTKCAPSEAFQIAAELKSLPDPTRHRSLRRARDEDEKGTRVLLQKTARSTRPAD